MTKAKGRGMDEMIKVELKQRAGHPNAVLMICREKAFRLKAAMHEMEPGVTYLYEEANGNMRRVRFAGFDGLNAAFYTMDENDNVKADLKGDGSGGIFFAPVIDMSDGSLFTEYIHEMDGDGNPVGAQAERV